MPSRRTVLLIVEPQSPVVTLSVHIRLGQYDPQSFTTWQLGGRAWNLARLSTLFLSSQDPLSTPFFFLPSASSHHRYQLCSRASRRAASLLLQPSSPRRAFLSIRCLPFLILLLVDVSDRRPFLPFPPARVSTSTIRLEPLAHFAPGSFLCVSISSSASSAFSYKESPFCPRSSRLSLATSRRFSQRPFSILPSPPSSSRDDVPAELLASYTYIQRHFRDFVSARAICSHI